MTTPRDPGNPENTDEQNLSPDDIETAVEKDSESQGVNEDDDLLTTQPDPTVDGPTDPTVEATIAEDDESDLAGQVNEALADVEAELAAEEAEAQEPTAEAQLAERTEDLQRVTAEYANYRRRTERERAATIENAKASVITDLLPLLDDLDLAAQHGDVEEGPLKAFNDKFRDILRGQKLQVFGEDGEDFDPEIHEAVQDLSSGDDKVVGTVLRKGYRVGDRMIRTAMVIISDRNADA